MTDKLIKISSISRDYKTCTRKDILWSDFAKKFKTPRRGKETLEEYKSLSKDKQDKLKNIGGYVGGVFKDNMRKKENLLSRCLITLDLDNIEANTLNDVFNKVDKVIGSNDYLIHSSRKHSVEAPRLRVIIPLDRDVNSEEYEAIARKIGDKIGFDLCDKTTFEPSRLMYYPSCCKDADYVYKLNEGELLKADNVLNMYDNWQDRSYWKGIDKNDIYKNQSAKQQDPLTKEGIIGEFCRAYYPIDEAIEEFLSDVYSPCDIPNRYSYIKGSTTCGVVIYDDKFSFSHHNTDPTGGFLCNAFDLVRIHKFSDLDKDLASGVDDKELPSFKAMVEFANDLDKVKKQRERDSYNKAVEDFSTPIAPLDNSIPFLTNINKVKYAAREGFDIYIVDSDKEASKLNELDYTVTYISGVSDDTKVWQYAYSEFFKGSNVIIVQNNNDDSKNFVEDTKKKLKYYAHSIKVLPMETDLLDYFENHSKGDFKDLVKEAPKTYAPWVFISDKGKILINEGLLAKDALKSLSIITKPIREKTICYLYKNGVYSEVSKSEIKREIGLYTPPQCVSDSFLGGVANRIITNTVKKGINLEGKENIINFKNGLYDVKTKKLKPHSKKYINLIQINANYKENPINKGYWDKFLDEFTLGRDELKTVIQEIIGLTISNYAGYLTKSNIILLYGVGDTGKSQIIDLLVNLLGKSNTDSIEMKDMGEKFSLANIENIRLIKCGELSFEGISDNAIAKLKLLSGRDDINIEKKGIDKFDIKYKGMLLFGSNYLPHISGDLGDWVFDRMIPIPCDNHVPKDKQDPKILDKLLEDKEYIIKWSIEGLERLINNNNYKFTQGPIINNLREEYKLDTDSVRAYIKDCCKITENKADKIKTTILHDCYCVWCNDNGFTPVGKKNFKKRLANIGVEAHKLGGIWYYTNLININSNYEPLFGE